MLSNGLCVSPLKGQTEGQAAQPRSLRDVVYQIDNDRDFKTYVMSFSSKVGGFGGAPQLPPHQFSSAPPPQPAQPFHNNAAHSADLPPLRPVFGISLDELFIRDGSAVPMVVHQCIQAVDLFGLEVEGIYRLSGTASHVSRIRGMFDNGRLYHTSPHPPRNR